MNLSFERLKLFSLQNKSKELMQNILETIQNTIVEMRWVELVSVIAAIIYVILAARQNIWCWLFGIISAILWTYAAAVYYKLYVDSILQVYYVLMGIYGWYAWTKGFKNNQTLPISQLKLQNHIVIIVGGLILTYLVGTFFKHYTDAVATYLDAFTTIFSIITTILVARKILENWLYWIIIDGVYIYLYGGRGGYLFAFLNVVYVIIAIIGYWNWRKQMLNKNLDHSNIHDIQALKE